MKRVLLGAVASVTGGVWNEHWDRDVEDNNSCCAIFSLFCSLLLCLLGTGRCSCRAGTISANAETPHYLGLRPELGGGSKSGKRSVTTSAQYFPC